MRVLFVCTANICRSPHMELTARALAGPGSALAFHSAGTHGFDAHPMDEVMAATLPAGAADGFASRRLTRAILEESDLVLTAEATHRAFILEEFPQFFRKVFTLGQFAAAVDDHPGVRGRDLLAAVGARRTPPRREHDVADPYRRGDSAAQEAAGTMSTMLGVIIPVLEED